MVLDVEEDADGSHEFLDEDPAPPDETVGAAAAADAAAVFPSLITPTRFGQANLFVLFQ